MQTNLNEENIAETNAMVAEVVQEADQSVENAQLVRNVVARTAFLVTSNPSVVDEEVSSKVSFLPPYTQLCNLLRTDS